MTVLRGYSSKGFMKHIEVPRAKALVETIGAGCKLYAVEVKLPTDDRDLSIFASVVMEAVAADALIHRKPRPPKVVK